MHKIPGLRILVIVGVGPLGQGPGVEPLGTGKPDSLTNPCSLVNLKQNSGTLRDLYGILSPNRTMAEFDQEVT